MLVIGIDPGKTIGGCVYDTETRTVVEAWQVGSVLVARDFVTAHMHRHQRIGIERPRIYQHGGNELADTCEQFGALWWALGGRTMPGEGAGDPLWCPATWTWLRAMTRGEVCKRLSAAMGSQVKGDAGVWAALLDLHGGKGIADKRPTKKDPAKGPLAELAGKPHAKAALAVAWAVAQGVES